MDLKISNLMYILKYFDNSKHIKKNILFFQLNEDKAETMVNWSETYDLGVKLNFLNEKKGITEITSKGKTFYLMSNNFSELNIEQKLFTFKNGILNNTYFKFINNFLKLFSINKENILEFYKTQDNYTKLRSNDRFILFELSILIHETNKITINEKFAEILSHQKLFGKSELSQSELDRINDEKKEIGDKGEKLTLQYEKNQFKKKKWNYQEKNVRIIGGENVLAGYDVESFLTQKSRLNFEGIGDKHIEVKSRKYDEFSFIISANELKIGKILSEKENHEYLIYFWNNLGSKNPPTSPTRIIPFEKLNVTPCKNCLNYLVNME